MKITHITTYRLPPRWMFLKIETDEGVVGWGEPVIEGRARTVEAAVHEFADYLIGKDPARINDGTVAKLAMRQPFVLFKGLTFQKLCLPGAFRPGDHHNKMLRPGLCVVHASPQYL
ncbi:hypothetical protein J4951_004379 [Salmonella enterica subsp. enterica serovar Enteritidis]|nr:hypothetical protein [Salmonella enterica subsp. enterica serovar Enteritidis]